MRAIEEISPAVPPERRDEFLRHLRMMALIRQFEEKAAEMYTRAKIGGYLHLNSGEEATIVGAISAIRPTDYIFTSYREHGHALARGISANAVMAELFGKETGTSRGRGGSMHIFDASMRFMGGYGIVGGQLPLAVGAALAIDYRGDDDIVLCLFGEGATNIGAFHESLNLAKLWRLPVVWLCVNNHYAMGSPEEKDSAASELYRKALAYDMVGERVDGMDLLAVQAVVAEAAHRARVDREPTLIEADTYRFKGHSVADPGKYRTEEEVRRWLRRDPIERFKRQLIATNLLTEDEFAAILDDVNREVQESVDFSERSPFPAPETLTDFVYATPEANLWRH
ncbi:MAG: pyruvate dehydrogenase (acetyl-transferring) E1 component subunit alpha [Dehalococcoidia bacterium]|nr:pyruvate dehydrogenase (acetyl-transferring) E1 component subunit alpha [Dehalococcoidia bacterium]